MIIDQMKSSYSAAQAENVGEAIARFQDH